MVWRFIRDDIWTYFAFVIFCVGCFGLLFPVVYDDMHPFYAKLVFAFGAGCLSLRVLKLVVLLTFGDLVSTELVNVDHRGYGVCVVRYEFEIGGTRTASKRQIYHRNGELQALCLPALAGFHLVAWAERRD